MEQQQSSIIYDAAAPTLSLNLLAESVSSYSDSAHSMVGDNFFRGCQFSPDGYCVLTAKRNQLQLFNTPIGKLETTNAASNSWNPVLTYDTGDSIRSYSWYPNMKSSDPASCCFVGVSRDSPVHLYDAYSKEIRATYCPYNAMDEMESPTTVCFVERGQQLVMGGFRTDRMLHVFDINRPGRQQATTAVLKLGKTRRSKDGQKGLVSALAYSEDNGVVAVGTYSPGSIYLYDLRMHASAPAAEVVMSGNCVSGHGKARSGSKRKRVLVDDGDDTFVDDPDHDSGEKPLVDFSAARRQWFQNRTRSGVTQLEFDSAGQYLFSCSRRSNAVIQWDLRKLSISNLCPGITSFEIDNDTNQRVEFQLYKDQIWMGGMDGSVRNYDLSSGKTLTRIGGFRGAVNGVSLATNATSKGAMLAVSTGTRHFPLESDQEETHDAVGVAFHEATDMSDSLEVHAVSVATTE